MQGVRVDFLFYLSRDWERFHRPGMIRALAKLVLPNGGKVLCVNRPVYLIPPLLFGNKLWRWLVTTSHTLQLEENLYLCTPWVIVPDIVAHRIPGIASLNRKLLSWQIRRTLRALGFRSPLVAWIYHPYQIHYVGSALEDLTVYECYDEHSQASGLRKGDRELIKALERKLFGKSDLVFTTSARLREAKEALHSEIHVVNNAAEVSFFSRVSEDCVPLAKELEHRPRPIIGYLGTIHEHLDIELLCEVALSHPYWTLLIIGEMHSKKVQLSSSFRRLESLPNVIIKGWVDWNELLGYCKAFDVGIIPYRRDASFNRFVNPNKLHEYTAMGIPVVSTDVVDVETHKDLLWIADDYQSFLNAIEEALRANNPAARAARLNFAQQHSWVTRVETMLAVTEKALAAKEAHPVSDQ